MQKITRNLASVNILSRLAEFGGVERDGQAPADLIGARIVRFGILDTTETDGGNLAIDYFPASSAALRRVVIGLNEPGMWIEYHGDAVI